jgi:hypothetical protein
MAVNNAGTLLDTAGEIAIDFVWGNMPPQPNDARTTRLDLTLGDHINLESGWGGFPQYTENTPGSDVAGSTDYVRVPTVLGFTTADADDVMKDSGLTVTTAAGATNTATQITTVNATTTTSATLTIAGGTSTWAVGTKVTITAGTGIPAALVGTFSVTGGSGSTLIIAGTGFTVANSGAITPGTVLTGTAGTIKSQSIAGGAATTAVAAAVTITPWAASA